MPQAPADPQLADRLQDAIVQPAVGDDDAAVGGQLAAVVELERPAVDVGDRPAGLGDDQGAGGMVPDLLAVIGAGREPEIDVGLAPRDDGILGLAVHAERRRAVIPSRSAIGRRIAVGAMPRLDRLAEPHGRRIVAVADPDRAAGGPAPRRRPLASSGTTNAPSPRTA